MKLSNSTVFGSLFSNACNSLLTLLYPQECRICNKSVEFRADGFICRECWRSTHIFSAGDIVCRKCSRFLKRGISVAETFCHLCETDEYDLARSIGLYEKALAISILNLKKLPFLPLTLQNLILDSFDKLPFHDAELVIPVPLSTRRERERGFNQSALIAQKIAKYKDLTVDERSLKRIVHTEKHRAGMDRKSRAESVLQAFEVKRPRIIKDKNILLVDDVFTSGATVSNCAKALKKAGAQKVYVLTIARAF